MRAAFLAIGTELLGTDRLDTNSLRLAALLERYGLDLRRKAVVGDLVDDIRRELEGMLRDAALVVVSGGLGPTADDVTREAVAGLLDRRITVDEAIVDDIREKFRRMDRDMPEVNRRQAEVLEGAELIPNPRGTAPGMVLEGQGGSDESGAPSTLFLLPGVPRELEGMLESAVEPWLAQRTDGQSRETGALKVACTPESELEQLIAPAYGEFGREAITVLARPADITVRFTATGPETSRREHLDAMRRRLTELIGTAVYGRHGEDSLEAVVGEELVRHGETVGTAESCTGGLVAQRLTGVAGSSAYFLGSVVTYSNALKESLLRIPQQLIDAHGAVNEEVAGAMASGARQLLGCQWALALTGVAGPGGGSEEKPVGTVHIALAGPKTPDGRPEMHHRRVRLPGDRDRVRWMASQVALEILRRRLQGGP